MDKASNKTKIIAIVVGSLLLLSIAGLAIYGLVGGNATQNDNTSTQNDTAATPDARMIQQNLQDTQSAVQKEANDYKAAKDAYDDKERIKLVE